MKQKEQKIILARMDPELVSKEIGDFILGKALSIRNTGGVIGLSGGVDSTTTAALAKKAFERYSKNHEQRLELVAYLLPSKTNNPEDTIDGEKVAKRLGIRYEMHSIEPLLEAFRMTNPEAFINNYDKGNLASRIRANVLNTKSATERKILLGTGNKDEDYGIGYYTLFGDGAVHINPIGALPKRLVCEMASYLGFPDLANRIPTAGLEPGQTDFKDLGYKYSTVELTLEGARQGIEENNLFKHSQIIKAATQDITEYARLYDRRKFDDVGTVVEDILKRHHNTAEKKSEIIHPPIPEITLYYDKEVK